MPAAAEAPPAAGEPAAPPKKKSRKWLWIGCGCLVLLLIACIVAVVLTGSLARFGINLAANTAAPYAQLQADLVKLKAGQVQDVYDSATAQFKANTTLDDFKGYVDQNPLLKDWTGQEAPDIKVENDLAVIKLGLKGPSETKVYEFQYAKEGTTWKLQYIGSAKP